jgi:hypothetical protein
MSTEDNKALARRAYDVINQGNLAATTSLVRYVAQRSSNCKETRSGATPTTGIWSRSSSRLA